MLQLEKNGHRQIIHEKVTDEFVRRKNKLEAKIALENIKSTDMRMLAAQPIKAKIALSAVFDYLNSKFEEKETRIFSQLKRRSPPTQSLGSQERLKRYAMKQM